MDKRFEHLSMVLPLSYLGYCCMVEHYSFPSSLGQHSQCPCTQSKIHQDMICQELDWSTQNSDLKPTGHFWDEFCLTSLMLNTNGVTEGTHSSTAKRY